MEISTKEKHFQSFKQQLEKARVCVAPLESNTGATQESSRQPELAEVCDLRLCVWLRIINSQQTQTSPSVVAASMRSEGNERWDPNWLFRPLPSLIIGNIIKGICCYCLCHTSAARPDPNHCLAKSHGKENPPGASSPPSLWPLGAAISSSGRFTRWLKQIISRQHAATRAPRLWKHSVLHGNP